VDIAQRATELGVTALVVKGVRFMGFLSVYPVWLYCHYLNNLKINVLLLSQKLNTRSLILPMFDSLCGHNGFHSGYKFFTSLGAWRYSNLFIQL